MSTVDLTVKKHRWMPPQLKNWDTKDKIIYLREN